MNKFIDNCKVCLHCEEEEFYCAEQQEEIKDMDKPTKCKTFQLNPWIALERYEILKEENKRLRNCMNCGNWDIEEMMCGLVESKEVACRSNVFKKSRPCGDKWCSVIEGI